MNKKGYLLSELIISFGLSFVILLVIFNTTINLNKKLSDLFVENKANSQQIVFNRKIANDFVNNSVVSMKYDSETSTCTIGYDIGEKILIIKEDNVIYDNEKINVSSNMKISSDNVTCEINGDGIAVLKVPIKHPKQTKNFGIELYNLSSSFIY